MTHVSAQPIEIANPSRGVSRETILRRSCQRTFGLDPHQVRYLLETFRSQSIAEDFLIYTSQVSFWRRRLGMPQGRRGFPVNNGARGVSKHFPAFP